MAASLTQWISRAADRFPCPPALRFFLFGTPEPLKELLDATQDALRNESGKAPQSGAPVDFEEIGRRLAVWTNAQERFVELPLEVLAGRLGYERRDLSDYFRFQLGTSYRAWRADQKVQWAKRMLLDPQYDTILDVALELGFRDDANLHRLFRNATGFTPGQWRSSDGHPEMD